MSDEATKDPELWQQRRWVGQRLERREDGRLLSGRARYTADIEVPGALEAAFVRSHIAHGVIDGIELGAALSAPGVVAIYIAEDFAAEPLQDILVLPGLHKTPRPALATGKVRYVGEPIAMVVAQTRYQAEDAVDQVMVDIDPLPAVTEADREGPPLFDHVPRNRYYEESFETENFSQAMANADVTFEKTVQLNRYMAAPMEPRGGVVVPDLVSDRFVYYTSTQCPHLVRSDIAKSLGMHESSLRVVAPEVGGGFGQKGYPYPEDLCVVAASVKLGVPVRWIEDRREHLLSAAHAKEQVVTIRIGATEEGRVTAISGEFVGDAGAYSFGPYAGLIEPLCSATSVTGPYDIKDCGWRVVGALTNKSPIGPYRGVGWSAVQTAREMTIGDLCVQQGWDRSAMRLKNLIASDAFPYETAGGQVYDSGSYVESLELANSMVERAAAAVQGQLSPHELMGTSVSPFVESTGWGTKASFEAGFPAASHDNATVRVDPDGTVTAAVGVSSHGQGHETSLAQLVADALGVDYANVRIVQGDTDTAPFGMGTYASRSAVIGGGALGLASIKVREKLLAVASELMEVDREDLTMEDGRVSVVGSPELGRDMSELAREAHFNPGVRHVLPDPELAGHQFFDPEATYSNGAVGAVVAVDPATGGCRVLRMVAVEDCGTMLNPTIVEGQIRGGIAQGIGGAMTEQLTYDENGQPLSTTYLDYVVPSATEVPDIEIEHLETPSPLTVGGIKGMAEGSTIATPGVLANAVANALRQRYEVRIDRFPLVPSTVVESIAKQPTSSVSKNAS